MKDIRFSKKWIQNLIKTEGKNTGEINYIFCSDEQLYEINMTYLHHDTYTDVITFDYSEKKLISGDIYISIDRVKENSKTYNISFKEELLRVMSHGVFHLCGYGDHSVSEQKKMRSKENEAIEAFKSMFQIQINF